MDKPKLRYIHAYVDRHGTPRYYFRRKGTKTPLPGTPGSRAFMRAYERLLAGDGAAPVSRPAANYTWRRLIDAYYQTPEFTDVGKGTQAVYRGELERFAKNFADMDVRDMDYEALVGLRKAMQDTPSAFNNLLKRMRQCLRLAIRLKWIQSDPSAGMKKFKGGSVHTWTDEQIAQFEAYWPLGTFERTGYALHLYTGQRRGDVNAMRWPEAGVVAGRAYYDGDTGKMLVPENDDGDDGATISLSQEKTGTRVDIPVHPKLAEALAAWPRKGDRILYGRYGRPVGKERMGEMMYDAIVAAGLPEECRMHGLRKVASVRLVEAGCTPHEAMAITGHRSVDVFEGYAEKFNRKELAKVAVRKLRAVK